MELTAYILCPETIQSQLYGWLDDLAMPVQLVSAPYHRWQVPEDAGIVITHRHYRWDELAVLRQALAQANVPVLVLADGILEYRNTWENPNIPPGVMFQPLMGHKLACLGRAQARWVESWGNPGSAEVIGLPHLDRIQPADPRPSSEPCRILVATARTPAFDEAQRERVVAALRAVRDQSPTEVHGRPVEFVWRLSAGLDAELELKPEPDQDKPRALDELIGDVDAVITTPSTLFLESLKSDRPTALLDFHRCPHYVPAAWTISSADQVAEVVAELARPPEPKMEFQRFTLHDQLECQTAATPRMLALVTQMVDLGVQARAQGQPLQFPSRLVPLSEGRWSSDLEPAAAFPDHPAFADRDVARLQVELSAALARLESLFDNNDHLRQRVRELHDRVTNLRARFGVEPRDPSSTANSEDAHSP